MGVQRNTKPQCNHTPALKVFTEAQADQNGALNRRGIKALLQRELSQRQWWSLILELFYSSTRGSGQVAISLSSESHLIPFWKTLKVSSHLLLRTLSWVHEALKDIFSSSENSWLWNTPEPSLPWGKIPVIYFLKINIRFTKLGFLTITNKEVSMQKELNTIKSRDTMRGLQDFP